MKDNAAMPKITIAIIYNVFYLSYKSFFIVESAVSSAYFLYLSDLL